MKRIALAGLALLILAPLGAERADANPEASQVVEKLHANLIGVMKRGEELGYEGRFEQLTPAIDGAFDLDFAAKKSLGRHWRKLSETDIDRWKHTFRQSSIATYADRFTSYSGERFEITGVEPFARSTFLVRTRIVRPGKEAVQLNYRLRDSAGHWRIVDVYLDGKISELALRRSEYASIVQRQGFETLLDSLRRRHEEAAQR